MKTLTEHNAMIDSCVNDTKVGDGVLCPMCFEYKEEIQMYFTNQSIVLLTYPSKQEVYCPSCGFKDFKLSL